MAERNGFPVYKSMDALSDALKVGYAVRQRMLPRAAGESTAALYHAPRKPVPLTHLEEIVADMETISLPAVWPSLQPIRSSTPRPIVSQATRSTMSSMPQSTVSRAPQPRVPAVSEPVPPSAPPPKRGYRRLPAVLIVLTILALSGAGLGSLLVLYHPPPVNMQPALPEIVGHVYFLTSGQVNEITNQGIDDEVQVDLSNLANPAPEKTYYGCLLSDQNQRKTTPSFLVFPP